MSEYLVGNHYNFYDIEVKFNEVTVTVKQVDISIQEMFPDADTEFDFKDLRKLFRDNEINENICFNKRNGNVDKGEFFFKGF